MEASSLDSKAAVVDEDCDKNVDDDVSQCLPVSEETLKTILDYPKLITNTFFMAKIVQQCSFRLSDDEWKKIEPCDEKPNTLKSCWTSVMARHLSEFHLLHVPIQETLHPMQEFNKAKLSHT